MHLYGEAARCDSEISDSRVVECEPGRCTWMVEPTLVGRHICSDGKRVHLYGGAAAMRIYVMPLQWERKCIVQELFVALLFSFAFTFALAYSFSKTFGGSFLGALVGAFLQPFSEPLGVNFPLPLFLSGMWRGGRSESLPLPLPLGVLGGAPIAFGNRGNSLSYCWEE